MARQGTENLAGFHCLCSLLAITDWSCYLWHHVVCWRMTLGERGSSYLQVSAFLELRGTTFPKPSWSTLVTSLIKILNAILYPSMWTFKKLFTWTHEATFQVTSKSTFFAKVKSRILAGWGALLREEYNNFKNHFAFSTMQVSEPSHATKYKRKRIV